MEGVDPGHIDIWLTDLITTTVVSPFYRSFVTSLDLSGNERVLDAGSGSGVMAEQIARRLVAGGGQLTCLDVSAVWLSVASRRMRRFHNVTFLQRDLTQPGADIGQFDAAVIHFVLHDIAPDQRPSAVALLAMAVRPGGRLFLREPLSHGLTATEVRQLLARYGLSVTRTLVSRLPMLGEVITIAATRAEIA